MVSEKNATMTDQDEDEGLDEDQEDQEDQEDLEGEDFEESEESGESEDEDEGDDSSSSSADEAPPAPSVATPPKGRKGGGKGKSASSKPDPAPVLALAKDDGKSKSTNKAKDNGKSTIKAKGKPSTPPKSAATATATALDKSRIRRIAQIMHLVTDETRLTILNLLMVEGELNVGDLCNRVEQTQPAVSHHLALLRVSGIIEPDRRGKHNFYMLTEDGHRLTKIFEYVG